MPQRRIDELTLDQIMTRWPQTLTVFVTWRLHCIGCPIADFHRLADSADEHGYELEDLRQAIQQAIAGSPISAAPPRSHRRSAAGGAGP